ncbi:Pol polyprotein, partial [Trichinella spiralis]
LDGPGVCAAPEAGISIREKDFTATYCPSTRSWTAAWKWSDAGEPGVLRNTVEEYPPANVARGAYEDELRKWIKDGWLVPYDESKHGPPKGLLPLMAVIQRNKKKVRPVMDFRELNAHIESHTADADVCSQKLREWRRQGVNVALIDLKKAYLQIRIDKSLWPYQTVVFKGKRYCLTRLGFGLNVAPLVMKAVLNCVLSRDPDVRKGTSAYIDDILVNESVVAVDRVKRHLAHYGLTCKTHERAADGARLLGLKVWGERGKLMWRRDNNVGGVPDVLTRRSVFSYCGKLVSHFPVCGWLRIAAAYIKRKANDATTSWDEVIDGDELRELNQETALAVKKRDPARGRWDVSAKEAKIWVDASSLAIGVALEVGGSIVEDAAWLRPDDVQHINMAELDAVIKGLNLALSWQMRRIRLMTDSATVHRWVSDGLSGKVRQKTKASGEMLIRRRVGMILSLVEEFGLELEVDLVKSACNKADELTRVPRRWLKPPTAGPALVCAATAVLGVERMIADVHHAMGHPGIRRTLYFARRTDPTVSKRQVRQVISGCEPCKSLDPAPGKWKRGSLEVEEVWQRVGMDITHVRGLPYLTLIDCRSSRFAVWRRLRVHCSANVTEQLEAVFCERGAPEELLTDNDTAFRGGIFTEFIARWGVRVRYRCAYAPSGNGIAERCHRSVKVIAARKNCMVEKAVYLYNVTPRDGHNPWTAPANVVHAYAVRVRGVDRATKEPEEKNGRFAVGDSVWVRPPGARCDTRHQKGTVTGVVSDQAVEVDGMPRHVRDLRRRMPSVSAASDFSEHTADEEEEMIIHLRPRDAADADQSAEPAPEPASVGPRRSTRIRRPTARLCCD